jgi:hypothetical protein
MRYAPPPARDANETCPRGASGVTGKSWATYPRSPGAWRHWDASDSEPEEGFERVIQV